MATLNTDMTFALTDSKTAAFGVVYQGTVKLTQTDNTAGTKVFTASPSTASPVTYDLTTGLTDNYGAALVFATCARVVVQNTHATASLVVGGGSNPLFGTDAYTVKAGATLPIMSSFTVDSTHKQITITPSASCTFNVLVLGS